MKKFFEIDTGEKVYKLRLSLAVQKRISDKYKEKDNKPNALQIITMACDDPAIMGDVLAACVNWDGKNPVNPDDIYDDLLEAGLVSGAMARTKILMDLCVCFGLVTVEQASAFQENTNRNIRENIEELKEGKKKNPEPDEADEGDTPF